MSMPPTMSALARDSLKEVPLEGRFILKKLFTFLNTKCFGGRIPSETRVTWNERLKTTMMTSCKRTTKGEIRLNKSVLRDLTDRDIVIDVLLHAMIHEYIANFVLDALEQEEDHNQEFQKMMQQINKDFQRCIKITHDQPALDRAVERNMKHRWKCAVCNYTYKFSRNVKVVPQPRIDEHASTGCKGNLVKLSHREALADIKEYCLSSSFAEGAQAEPSRDRDSKDSKALEEFSIISPNPPKRIKKQQQTNSRV